MKKSLLPRPSRALGSVGIALAALGLGLASSGQQQGPGVPQAVPPAHVYPWQDTIRRYDVPGNLSGLIALDDQSLRVSWRFGSPQTALEERFDLEYWPTAVAQLNGTYLLVAGKRPSNGNTVIEEWTLLGLPSPQAPTPVSKRVVYDANIAGKREALTLYYLRGAASRKALVQFADSRNLFRLNVLTGSLGLILDSSQAPTLQDWRPRMTAGGHPQFGNVYVPTCHPDFPCTLLLVLVDSDRNGSIDTWSEMSIEDAELTYGNPEDWMTPAWD